MNSFERSPSGFEDFKTQRGSLGYAENVFQELKSIAKNLKTNLVPFIRGN